MRRQLIPFLEHDDANRALMGSNMQRQAVPLLVTEAPLVATGLEDRVARDSRAVLVAEEAGKVASVTGNQIIITEDGKLPEGKKKIKHDPGKRRLGLSRPQIHALERGDLHQPENPGGQGRSRARKARSSPTAPARRTANWRSAAMCSSRSCRGTVTTSRTPFSSARRSSRRTFSPRIHIDEFEVGARDTKLGPEEITRDIPNLGDEALKNLGPDGVIRIGAEVKPGDILVGKITPKIRNRTRAGRTPAARHFRRKGRRREGHFAQGSVRHLRHRHGRESFLQEGRRTREPNRSSTEEKRHAKQIEDDHKKKTDELRDQLTEALSNILLGEKIPLDVVNQRDRRNHHPGQPQDHQDAAAQAGDGL